MGISLTEAIAELPLELYAAYEERAQAEFRCEVEPAEPSPAVESRRDGKGGVKVEAGPPRVKTGVQPGGGLGSTRRQALTLGFRMRDEARGGASARIRRPAGGLDARDSADAVGDGAPTASIAGAPRPWES
ncbi:trypco2 family protein [Streptomyces wedmorensis]|uniref:Trypco2 family protein n=1 Tax=Streptomyces wedmorensis TaxID=43759 RepID=A0ABW6J3A9_STRWE